MNMMTKHRAEALRRLRNHDYEITDNGKLLIAKMGLLFGGHFETQAPGEGWTVSPNLVVDQGIMHIVTVAMAQGAQSAAFYIAPFSGDVTPASTWTAANFTATATEFTNYESATRMLWAKDAPSANSVGNNTTPATFVMSTGGGTIRGMGLMSVSTKSATGGSLVAAARLAADKTLGTAEELKTKYILTGTST